MSGLAKCPCCGNNMRYEKYGVMKCGTCAFACGDDDYERLLVAMDLAKTWDKNRHVGYEVSKPIYDKIKFMLDVFKSTD